MIVVGNEKGGSGKSTTAFHLAIYLLYQGYRVASIDVDSRQQTFTNYVRNRRNWVQAKGLTLPHTTHYHLPLTRGDSIKENQKLEFDLHLTGFSADELLRLLEPSPGPNLTDPDDIPCRPTRRPPSPANCGN